MSNKLEYIPANNTRPFRAFERVQVLNRDGQVLSTTVVSSVQKKKVTTGDGREWSLSGLWFDGQRCWTFPTIRPEEAADV